MKQQQTKHKKQDSNKNLTHQTGQSPSLSQVVDHPYLRAQGIIGNHGILRRYGNEIIQAKLKVGQPNDKYEQEADRVADQIMRMPTEPPLEKIDDEIIQTKPTGDQAPAVTPGIESGIKSLKGGGQPLPESMRSFFEPRFGYDFSRVRVHTDRNASSAANSINAKAFTIGRDVVFGAMQYSPGTFAGKNLLAHELSHVIQQTSGSINSRIQRQEVRSPVFEEAVTQIETVEGAIHGRQLTTRETDLARSIYRNSIDYSRVRIIETALLEWRTIGNNIRVPRNFSIRDASMAQIFIHEMTHVWQYQHTGTSYISVSLADQLIGWISTGDRGAAYEYTIVQGRTFFEYGPEQQASIVERYYALLQQRSIPDLAPGERSRIDTEIASLQPLIDQMQAALPRSETLILEQRATDLMQTPGFLQDLTPPEQQLMPVRPFLEVRF